MPINFPLSPSLNDTYTYQGQTWKWNNVAWEFLELTSTDTGTYNESTTPPSSPSDGDRWHETDSGKLFTYSNAQSAWIEF